MKRTVFWNLIAIVLVLGFIGCDLSNNNNPKDNIPGLVVYQQRGQSLQNPNDNRAIINKSISNESLTIPGDDIMVGGGVIVFVTDMDVPTIQVNETESIHQPVPVTLNYEKNQAIFHTVSGHKNVVYLEFYLDGVNDTGLNNAILTSRFTATEADEISFYVNSDFVGLFANGVAHETNVIWYTNNDSDTGSTNPEERVIERENVYNLNGGYDYVARFLVE